MDDPLQEFAGATPIQKLHRYLIQTDGTVYFGLLGMDGDLRYFRTDPNAISNIAGETHDLARASRHIVSGNDYESFIPSQLPRSLPTDSASVVDPLIGPFLKLHRAHEHFDRLADVVTQYGARATLEPVEVETTGSKVTWRMQLSESPPGIIPLLIGDVIHNLRSALDILVCDLARLRGLGTKQFKFPFAENEAKLLKIFKDEHKRIGDDVCDAILALQPYTGGDPLLRGLHDLDIIDKHRLILPVYFAQWRRHDMTLRIADLMRRENPDRDVPKFVFLSDMENTPMPVGETIVCEVGEDPLRYYEEVKSPVLIRFPSGDNMPFQHAFVLDVLAQLFERVQGIVSSFATQFGPPNHEAAGAP